MAILPNILPPGVPTLLEPFAVLGAQALLTGDAPNITNILGSILGAIQWGVFDTGGNQVLQPDSITVFEYRKDWEDSDYPIEGGSFESYNKVEEPYEVNVEMTKGGSLTDRQSFLESIDGIAGDTNLYSLSTPEKTYVNGNIGGVRYIRRSDKGAGLLTIGIKFEEIRESATQSFTNVVSPPSADQQSGGTVQPVTPTTPQNTSILGGLM